jgi:hypothetical protein
MVHKMSASSKVATIIEWVFITAYPGVKIFQLYTSEDLKFYQISAAILMKNIFAIHKQLLKWEGTSSPSSKFSNR